MLISKHHILRLNGGIPTGYDFIRDADGNPVDPMSDPNIKYYPEDFNILPHLWD